MRRSGLFSGTFPLSCATGLLACRLSVALCVPLALLAQNLTREGGRWVLTVSGTAPPAARLRVNTQGPVHIEGGVANEIAYTAKVSVQVRSEEDARRILNRFAIRAGTAGDTAVLEAPGGPVQTNLSIRAPRLAAAFVNTSDGAVEANGIDGSLEMNSGAGALKCDRIRGASRLITAGGEIQVGEVGGDLHCSTAGGRVTVRSVRGNAVLETAGGDVEVGEAGGTVRADTGGGTIRVNSATGAVAATTGGGSIIVNKAGGVVTARNGAGPVEVGAAAGVRCESGSGRISISNIAGPMRVSTAFGSIFALLGAAAVADSFLETGNGDITISIPSNVGIRLTGSSRRIVSDYPTIAVRVRGPEMFAEGSVNGGGPLVRVTGAGGTIFIRRQ